MNQKVVDTINQAIDKNISVLIVGAPGSGKKYCVEKSKATKCYYHVDRLGVEDQLKCLNEIDNSGNSSVFTALSTENIHPALVDRVYVLHNPKPTVQQLLDTLPDTLSNRQDIALAADGSWRQLQRLVEMPYTQSDAYLRNSAVLTYLEAILSADLISANAMILHMRNLSLLPNAAMSKMVDHLKDITGIKLGVFDQAFSDLNEVAKTITETQIKVLLDLVWSGMSRVTPFSTSFSILWLMAVKGIELIHGLKFDAQLLKTLSDFS